MAKAAKKKEDTKKRGNYDEPLKVNGSFMDIMNAAVKNADANSKVSRKVVINPTANELYDPGRKGG